MTPQMREHHQRAYADPAALLVDPVFALYSFADPLAWRQARAAAQEELFDRFWRPALRSLDLPQLRRAFHLLLPQLRAWALPLEDESAEDSAWEDSVSARIDRLCFEPLETEPFREALRQIIALIVVPAFDQDHREECLRRSALLAQSLIDVYLEKP